MKLALTLLAVLVGLFLLKRLAGVVLLRLVGGWVGRAVGQAALAQQPDAIHLASVDPDSWLDRDAAHALAAGFREHGFADAGTFKVVEMHGVRVQLLAHEAGGMLAAVYEHPQVGQWFDVVARYGDGTSITFTTSRPTGLDPRPGHPVIHAPGETSPRALVERAGWERPPGPLAPASAADVVRLFEQAYADATAWRKHRGISAHEVAQVAMREAA
jgi:hypothetical protein